MRHLLLRLALAGLVLLVVGSLPNGPSGQEQGPPVKRVTLAAGAMPLSQALAEIARQSGVRIEDRRGEGDPTITLPAQQGTFWDAVDAVATAAKAQVVLSGREPQVTLEK